VAPMSFALPGMAMPIKTTHIHFMNGAQVARSLLVIKAGQRISHT
jgi:hypothetical protein